jgi:hypothetical protein
MIFSFPFQIARFSLDLSLCTSCVGFVSDIVHSFTSRTGLDWTGLDWTGLDFIPLPPTAFVIVLLALVVISPRAC